MPRFWANKVSKFLLNSGAAGVFFTMRVAVSDFIKLAGLTQGPATLIVAEYLSPFTGEGIFSVEAVPETGLPFLYQLHVGLLPVLVPMAVNVKGLPEQPGPADMSAEALTMSFTVGITTAVRKDNGVTHFLLLVSRTLKLSFLSGARL